MKVARLHGPDDIRIADEPVPVPGAGEELVRVNAVGICGSDLHWFTEGAIGDATLSRPLVLGHEIAGTIASGPVSERRSPSTRRYPAGSVRPAGPVIRTYACP